MTDTPSCTFIFDAIGTHWQIDIQDSLSLSQQQEVEHTIHQIITDFDLTYSRFRLDSLVMQSAQKKGSYLFPDNAAPLFALYKNLYDLTDGAFTPLIGQVLVDAGYDHEYSLISHPLTKPPQWQEAIEYHYPTLVTYLPVLLDFGAAGKGYLIDIVSDYLRTQQLSSFCLDVGGDIYYQNPTGKMLKVGLEHPGNSSQVIGVASICNESICGSAGNRRKWGNFHHIIDPRTLSSPHDILATWVVAKTTMLADGIATALFLTPAKKMQKVFAFEYAIVYKDYSLERSGKFPAEFFSS